MDVEQADERAAAADAALASANDRLIEAQISATATRFGLVDPEAAAVLVDRSGITVDDNGNVAGVGRAVRALVEQRPYLAGPTGSAANPGRRASAWAGRPQDLPAAIKRHYERQGW